jgi:hypothetical protein
LKIRKIYRLRFKITRCLALFLKKLTPFLVKK